MKYGSFIKSLLISVITGYFILISGLLISRILNGYKFNLREDIISITYVAALYFTFSFIGWLIIGIPSHFILCKWVSPKYMYYLYIVGIIFLLVFAFLGLGQALIISTPILFQVALFRFFVFKKTSNHGAN